MANKYFRYTRQPLRPEIMFSHIRASVEKELAVVGKAHVYERDQITQDFKHRPRFGWRVRTTPQQLRMEIYLKNPDATVREDWTIKDLWEALDRSGTRPHPMGPIFPKNKKALAFVVGGRYRAKTIKGGRFRGPGKVVGGKKIVRSSTRRFTHPGFKPRKFTERINKDLRPLFLKQAERGYRLGHQRALGIRR